MRDIDEALAPAVLVRQKHREKHGPAGQPFFDPASARAGSMRSSSTLRAEAAGPPSRPRRSAYYEDFASLPRAPPPPPGPRPRCLPLGAPRRSRARTAPPPPSARGQPRRRRPARPAARPRRPRAPPRAPRARRSGRSDRVRVALARLDAAAASDPARRYSLLPENHEARAAVAEVAAAAAASANGAPGRRARRTRLASPSRRRFSQRLVSADGGGGARGASASSSPSARRSTARRAPRRSRRWLATGRAASFSAR